MDNRYWIGRKRRAMEMARGAATAEARLIHYDLAGRYSIMAAQCLPLAAATRGERPQLHLPRPDPHPSATLPPRTGGDRS